MCAVFEYQQRTVRFILCPHVPAWWMKLFLTTLKDHLNKPPFGRILAQLGFVVVGALCVRLHKLIKIRLWVPNNTSLCWLCCRTSVGPRPRPRPSHNLEPFVLASIVRAMLFWQDEGKNNSLSLNLELNIDRTLSELKKKKDFQECFYVWITFVHFNFSS